MVVVAGSELCGLADGAGPPAPDTAGAMAVVSGRLGRNSGAAGGTPGGARSGVGSGGTGIGSRKIKNGCGSLLTATANRGSRGTRGFNGSGGGCGVPA